LRGHNGTESKRTFTFLKGVLERMICEEVVESNGAGLQNAFQENKAYTPSTLFPLLHFGVGKGYPAMAFVGF